MKKTYIWETTREDASHLGGPMGKEYTTVIESKPFSDKDKAFSYLEKIAKKYGEKLDKENWKGDKFFAQDIRCEIVYIRKKEVN